MLARSGRLTAIVTTADASTPTPRESAVPLALPHRTRPVRGGARRTICEQRVGGNARPAVLEQQKVQSECRQRVNIVPRCGAGTRKRERAPRRCVAEGVRFWAGSPFFNQDIDPFGVFSHKIQWGAAPFTLAYSNGQGVTVLARSILYILL